jgi:hypothetical protein
VKRFAVSTTINAPPEKVWSVLEAAADWPSWNTTVGRVEGTIADGSTIKLFVKLNPGRAFPVRVGDWRPPSGMTWTGGMPLGLFKGVRTFTLTPAAGGGTDFAMEEVFSGPLSPLIGRTIPDMQPAFEEFAACLKSRAEQG